MSRAKNIAKVLKERVKNPLDTTRNIAKKTWIDHSTVARIDKQLPQIATKSQNILDICETDFEIVKLAQVETMRRLQNPEAESFTDIIRAWSESTKRYSLFKWEITDKEWWMKNINNIEII